MHADQHLLAVADLALDHRDVRLAIDDALEGDDPELAVIGWQRRRRDAPHQRLGAHAVLDQIRDRDHQQLVPLRELRQLRHARHRAVVVHDFADDAGRIEAGDAGQVDGRLGLPGAHEHAAVARLERKHVAGPGEISGPGRRIDRRQHGDRAVARRDAGARHALGLDRHAERRVEARRVLRRPSAAGRAPAAGPRSSACR